jgi:hypoxanthine-DNA glycosylase
MKSSPAEARPLLTGLPPLIDERSRVLVLGSFPSEESLRKQQYYAYARNQFWPIVGKLFGFDAQASYRERTETLLRRGVGVWDVIGKCTRKGSLDSAIKDDEPNPLLEVLARHAGIGFIALNGGRAMETAQRQVPGLFTNPRVICRRMPSTSPAHAGMSLAAKVEAWSEIRLWLEGRPV